MKKLFNFNGYTVDLRLKQFRKVKDKNIEFIEFDSEKGEHILCELLDCLDLNKSEHKSIFEKLKKLF